MDADSEDMMKLIERVMALWNAHDTTRVNELYSSDFVGLDMTEQAVVEGPQGVAQQLERYVQAFPDLTFKTLRAIQQKDCVALFWTASGTHRGKLLNIPPTGRYLEVQGTTLLTMEHDKVKQAVYLWDMAGLLRAIGLLPELEPHPPIDLNQFLNALTVCD